jgi:cysteine-rich repeat protein
MFRGYKSKIVLLLVAILATGFFLVKKSPLSVVQAALTETKITASDGAIYDNFGTAVAINGNYAIVGAHYDDDLGNNAGSAYIFKNTGGVWSQIKKLTAGDGAADDDFGVAVSIGDDYAMVGARGDDSYRGSAYIFYKDYDPGNPGVPLVDNWGWFKKITASGGAAFDYFGDSISITGNHAIVGASYGDGGIANTGSAYIFSKDKGGADNWGQVKKITAGDGAANDAFGYSVSMDGDRAIVGAYNKNGGIGAAYIFYKDYDPGNPGVPLVDNWGQIKKITVIDGATNDYFGWSVGISGNHAIASSSWDDIDANTDQGSAYIFYKDRGGEDQWGQVKKITAGDGDLDDQFGHFVSIDGDYALVGAWHSGANSEGSAYFFYKNEGGADNWGQKIAKYGTVNGGLGSDFGVGVSINDNYAIIGADNDTGNVGISGAAYIFSGFLPVCGNNIIEDEEQCDDGNFTDGDGCSATCFVEFPPTPPPNGNETKIWALDGAASDQFSFSVYIDGDYAIVGSYGDESYKGSAYIFFRNPGGKWIQLKKLTASDGVAWDRFGYSVSISGDYAVVGAWAKNSQTGAAYVFYKDNGGADNWGEQKKITASDASPFVNFGYSVDMDGDYVIIGSGMYSAGDDKAYIYYKDQGGLDNWGEQDIITGNDTINGDDFGAAVAISGDYAIIGAVGNDPPGYDASGAAYIFQRTGLSWNQQGKLTANVKTDGAYFAHSVDIEGDYAAVSASNSSYSYVFKKPIGGWTDMTETARLTTGSQMLGGRHLISISGDHVAVGVSLYNPNYTGAIYLFTKPIGEEWSDTAESLKITASDGDTNDVLGLSVSVSGDFIIAGSQDDDNGADSGSAYIYSLDYCGDGLLYGTEQCDDGNLTNGDGCSSTCKFEGVCNQETKLTSSTINEAFGLSVAIDGLYAIVGASSASTGTGAAYIYKRDMTGWSYLTKITASDGALSDLFGGSVSISGDYAIVGAHYNDAPFNNQGAVYIFKKDEGGLDNWGQIIKFTSGDAAADDELGLSVSISGDYAIAGAGRHDSQKGTAYVLKKDEGGADNWGLIKELTASDPDWWDGFGSSVFISDDYAIVGAGCNSDNGSCSGSAYIFNKDEGGPDSWGQQAKLTASDGEAGDIFGNSVGINGDYAIASAPFDDDAAIDAGAIYVFKRPDRGGWSDTSAYFKKLTASGAWTMDYLGFTAATISGDFILAGTTRDADDGPGSGSVYVFKKDYGGADNWGEIRKLTASDGKMNDSFGQSISLDDSNIIIGAFQYISPAPACEGTGAVYIYPLCVSDSECGNGDVEWGEQCDDGNLTDGDGCSSTCVTTCGDGFLIRGEQCDDGNLANGDGCSAACELEDPVFYVDYDNGDGGDCSLLHPCKSISNLFGKCASFGNAIAGIKDVNVFVKGTRLEEHLWSDYIPNITAPSVTFQPWDGNTPVLNILYINNINNVTFDGFEITGSNSCNYHAYGNFNILTAGNNITFRNNYIHDTTAGLGMLIPGDPGISGDNIQISNNIFSNNSNSSDSCGGILMTGTTNSFILNNTFYNNCDVFDDANMAFGDLAVTQVSAWGVPAPQNTTVKQNIVFNNAGGNSYYYDVTGELINGTPAVGVLTNQSAVDHGGYNFLAATNPYKDAVSAVNWATAGTGFPLADSQYINYQIDEANLDPATLLTDYLGNIRPNGKSEAGAIEREQTGGGGGTSIPAEPVCMASTVKLDLPETLSVSQIGGKPAVTLNWVNEGSSTELNTRILFDYFNQSKKPVIGTEGKLAVNVFAKYALSEIAKDTELLTAFNRYIGKVNFDSLSDCACNEDEARYVVNAVRDLMTNVTISVKVKSLVTGFMNDILVLERVLSDAGQGATTPFTDFYMANSGITVTDAVTLDIYRNSNLIKSMDSSGVSSFTDDTVPVNNSGSVKYYDYYIVTKNKCGETSQGSAGQARIDPSIPDGTTVQVSLDLAIKVKEGYSQLFMEKLKNLLIQNVATQPSYEQGQENLCEQMRQAFLTEKKTDKMFDYILECFGGYDYLLRQKIEENRFNIVPPLLNLLRLNEGKETRENIVEQYMYPLISKFNNEISLQMTIKADISSLNLTALSIVNKTFPGELTEAQMDEIRKIDEKYFEGAGQAADLVIEKYDADNNLVGTYFAHTDVFGIAKNVSVGDMISGKGYTLKIRLKDAKYTLPKIVEINVGSAIKTGGVYSTVISLNFTKHFRYGDFNEDGVINLLDIIAWGSLIKEHPDLWQEANIDGLYGIDLLDVVTLQGNWGGLTDAMKEGGTMSIADLLEIFGLTLSPSLGGGSATVAIPSWINILTTDC